MPSHAPLAFFLGGHDLEMVTIKELLEREAPGRFFDKGLSWGATASAYQQEIAACLAEGRKPVLVELGDDLGLHARALVVVDHHGERAGRVAPTSLHQVFDLLDLPKERWTRWYELVAVNDRAYIPGLVEMGATREEIERVRALDRAAQGVTAEDEAEAARAVATAERCDGSRLTVVRMSHARMAAAADRLDPALGGPGAANLLVLSDAEVNFSGVGRLVLALNQRYPGGWYGGALPERGFWGRKGKLTDIVPFILSQMQE